MTYYYPTIQKWFMPMEAWVYSFKEMARDGKNGCEGVALWLGNRKDGVGNISCVVGVRGPGVIKLPALLNIQPEVINELTIMATELGLSLLGQIHSHGPLHGISFSKTDHQYGIKAPGFLSMVAPDYALRHQTIIADCSAYIFDKHLGYQRWSPKKIKSSLILTSNPQTKYLVIDNR